MFRFMDRNRKGPQLEYFKMGVHRYTSEEAIRRFLAADTAAYMERQQAASREPSAPDRREAERAGAALSSMGI